MDACVVWDARVAVRDRRPCVPVFLGEVPTRKPDVEDGSDAAGVDDPFHTASFGDGAEYILRAPDRRIHNRPLGLLYGVVVCVRMCVWTMMMV